MFHNDAKLPVMLGRSTRDVSISNFKYRGCLNKILKSIVPDNGHVDPITTRQEQKFIKLADKL